VSTHDRRYENKGSESKHCPEEHGSEHVVLFHAEPFPFSRLLVLLKQAYPESGALTSERTYVKKVSKLTERERRTSSPMFAGEASLARFVLDEAAEEQ
jgi:hypothetical protein